MLRIIGILVVCVQVCIHTLTIAMTDGFSLSIRIYTYIYRYMFKIYTDVRHIYTRCPVTKHVYHVNK